MEAQDAADFCFFPSIFDLMVELQRRLGSACQAGKLQSEGRSTDQNNGRPDQKKKKEQQAIHLDSGEQIKNVHNPLVNMEQ